jgi:WD40 repeat protein
MAERAPRRYFIGAATTVYRPESGFEDRPELADEVARMSMLFTSPEIGYQPVRGFGADLKAADFRDRLRAFLIDPDRRDSDIVVIYYTGHGHLDGGDLLLPMADTTADVAGTAIWAEELTTRLLRGDVRVQRLLFLLDTCYAAAGGGAIARGGIDFVNRLQGLANSPSVGVVVAARPREQASSGAFTQAFVDAVGHRASGGHEPEFLALDGLVDITNDITPTWQHARLYLAGDGVTQFLPNPRLDRWLRDLDLRTQALRRQRAARRTDEQGHVMSRARGLDTAGTDDLWLFTGRHVALREVCAWLREPGGPATMVITGHPGSGKSALLSRLYVLADRRLRNRVPHLHGLSLETLPPVGALPRFIHARGLTADGLLEALCEACDVDAAATSGQLLAELSGRTEPTVVVIDAIDEALGDRDEQARGSFPPVDDVLAPLVRAAGHTSLRLLLGTRHHLVDLLGGPARVIDLDADSYADPDSLRSYAASCLLHLADDSPYRHQPPSYLDSVAASISEAAGSSFLVALITARSLALRPGLVDPADTAWRAGLPREAAHAMREDLDQRLGALAGKARELLLPLAYSQGSGLPWEDLWPRLATALSGQRRIRFTSDDIDWLIGQAGFYIVESTDEGSRSTYRLYHEALAEHLRDDRDQVADQAVIVDTLAHRMAYLADGSRDWANAHRYIRNHVATHAALTDRLDSLLADPRYLLAAEPLPLLAALPSAGTADGRRSADAYRRALPRLRASEESEHPAYLQLAARCGRAPLLADAITTSGLPLVWSANWAYWRLQTPHRAVMGHTDWVNAVAVGEVEGRAVIVSGGNDATVRVWDAGSGAQVGDPYKGHTDWVTSVAVCRVDGGTVIVSGSNDATVRVWDPVTGTPIGDPYIGHTGPVTSVALGKIDGRTVIVSGGNDATVRVWDAGTGVRELYTGHTGPVTSVTIGQIAGHAVVVSGSNDATVRVWDLVTGTPLGDPCTGHTDSVTSVAVGLVDGRTVVVSGSADRTVRVWDLVTGTQLGDPYAGHTDWVTSVAIGLVDGRTVIVSGSDDATVRMWDPVTDTPVGDPYTGHTGPVNAVAVGRVDGRAVIVSGGADRTVRVWDAATGTAIGDPYAGHTGEVLTVAVGDIDGHTVIVSGGADATVRLWDPVTGTPVGDPYAGHTDWVRSVAVGGIDGRAVIVSGSDDATVRVWDPVTGTPVGDPYAGHTGMVISVAVGEVDGRAVIVSGSNDATVRVWDPVTGTPIGDPYTGHTDTVTSVAVGEVDGRAVIVSGSHDQTVRVWDPVTGTPVGDPYAGHTGPVSSVAVGDIDGRTVIVSGSYDATVRVWDPVTGTPVGDPYTGHTGWVNAVAVGDIDGRTVIISGSHDDTVRVWDPVTGTPVGDPYTGHTGWVTSVTVGEVDGHTVIVSGSHDRTVRMWDAGTGAPVGDPCTGHADAVTSVAVGEVDGRTVIISGSRDHTVRVWDPVTDTQVGDPYTGHTGWVNAVAAGEIDGRTVIVSGSDDQTVRVWDPVTGTQVGDPYTGHTDWVTSVAVGQVDGCTVIVSGGRDATVRVWDLTTGTPIGAPYTEHTDRVTSVAVGQVDGRTVIVSGSRDATVRVWDPVHGTAIGDPCTGHTGPVRAVTVRKVRGHNVIVTGSDDHTVQVSYAMAPGRTDRFPCTINLAAAVVAVAHVGPSHIVVATELGIVSLRLPGPGTLR